MKTKTTITGGFLFLAVVAFWVHLGGPMMGRYIVQLNAIEECESSAIARALVYNDERAARLHRHIKKLSSELDECHGFTPGAPWANRTKTLDSSPTVDDLDSVKLVAPLVEGSDGQLMILQLSYQKGQGGWFEVSRSLIWKSK